MPGTDVQVGDLYRDADIRSHGRVVKVIAVRSQSATVENVKHDDPKLIGRKTAISLRRLTDPFLRSRGYERITD